MWCTCECVEMDGGRVGRRGEVGVGWSRGWGGKGGGRGREGVVVIMRPNMNGLGPADSPRDDERLECLMDFVSNEHPDLD